METQGTIKGRDKIKNTFSEMVSNIDKPLAKLTKEKERRHKLIKFKTKRTVSNEIQKIIMKYFENFYFNKLKNQKKLINLWTEKQDLHKIDP